MVSDHFPNHSSHESEHHSDVVELVNHHVDHHRRRCYYHHHGDGRCRRHHVVVRCVAAPCQQPPSTRNHRHLQTRKQPAERLTEQQEKAAYSEAMTEEPSLLQQHYQHVC